MYKERVAPSRTKKDTTCARDTKVRACQAIDEIKALLKSFLALNYTSFTFVLGRLHRW